MTQGHMDKMDKTLPMCQRLYNVRLYVHVCLACQVTNVKTSQYVAGS